MEDTSLVCTLVIRNIDDWDDKRTHYFKVSTATYLQAGDYLVHYYIDTLWLHGEWIHIPVTRSKGMKLMEINKTILAKRIPLNRAYFIKPKDGTGVYLEY